MGADITDPFLQKGIKALQVLEVLQNDELAYQAGGMRYWPLTNGFVTVSGLLVAPTGDVLTFTPKPIVVLEYQDAHEAVVRQMAEATPLFEQADGSFVTSPANGKTPVPQEEPLPEKLLDISSKPMPDVTKLASLKIDHSTGTDVQDIVNLSNTLSGRIAVLIHLLRCLSLGRSQMNLKKWSLFSLM